MSSTAKFDVVVIGGGPAGMSAALWCCDLGLSAVLIEGEGELGGQMRNIHNPVRNYLGIEAANGRDLLRVFAESIDKIKFTRVVGVPVVNLDLQNKSVTLADKRTFTGRSIVLATGVRRRRLGITGEAKFEGRGVLRSGVAEKASVAGKRVVIVGGGDAALENAIILSETASSVTIVHRRNEFLAREDFLSRAEQKPNIDFMKNTAIEAINGDDRVRSISISTDSGLIAEVPTDFVLVRIGVIPNNELFADTLKTDPHGYVIVDSQAETSVDDIFAVGDIANPIAPTISTATGTAATAIKTIESKSN